MTLQAPSDSQDGARRRDDADTFGPHREERDKKGPFCFHCQVNWPCMPVEAYRTGRADVARLEAERDEARAAQLRLLRELTATCSCGTSPMTYEGPEPDCAVHGAVRAFNEAAAELTRMRPVTEAVAQLHRTYVLCGGRRMEPGDAWRMLNDFIDETPLAAVDQTAPSSPLETPHTVDGGEAGVVEGAGGSEAAEGVRSRHSCTGGMQEPPNPPLAGEPWICDRCHNPLWAGTDG